MMNKAFETALIILLFTTPSQCWSPIGNNHKGINSNLSFTRRTFLTTTAGLAGLQGMITLSRISPALAADGQQQPSQLPPVDVIVTGDAKKLFNEGRALELQGNIAASQRLYSKVTKIAPRFIYGYSSLGNTQTAFGELDEADKSYTKAIELCNENLRTTEEGLGQRRCNDLYALLLNRGCVRLNNGMLKEALIDLQQSAILRGRPDAIILQNLARAKELNGLYDQADRDYTTAISMTSNEVNPFWLRSALVKFELGDIQGGFDLLKRVENRFPEAPEVRAAYATFLLVRGDQIAAQRKFLEIPDRQRLKFADSTYLTKTIGWPPKMIESITTVTSVVGDKAKVSS